MSKRETVYLQTKELRASTNADGSRTVTGTIPYNRPSAGLPWVEVIAPGAFVEALKAGADVLCLRDHDSSLLLGRTLSGTLTLRDTADGLQFSVKLPNTTTANDLAESLDRGDISGTSFGFVCTSDTWTDDGKGNLTRTLNKVDLFEVSIVSFPAFPDSSASIRTVPKELRHLLKLKKRSVHEDGCSCDCSACEDNNCAECEDDSCEDAACGENGCPHQDDEDRSTDALSWAERTLLTLKVMSFAQFN